MTIKETVLSEKSLIPISLSLTACAFAYFVSGLSKDVENTAQAAARAETRVAEFSSMRSSLEAEIITQIKSQNISINEIDRKQAVLNSQMLMLLKILDKQH